MTDASDYKVRENSVRNSVAISVEWQKNCPFCCRRLLLLKPHTGHPTTSFFFFSGLFGRMNFFCTFTKSWQMCLITKFVKTRFEIPWPFWSNDKKTALSVADAFCYWNHTRDMRMNSRKLVGKLIKSAKLSFYWKMFDSRTKVGARRLMGAIFVARLSPACLHCFSFSRLKQLTTVGRTSAVELLHRLPKKLLVSYKFLLSQSSSIHYAWFAFIFLNHPGFHSFLIEWGGGGVAIIKRGKLIEFHFFLWFLFDRRRGFQAPSLFSFFHLPKWAWLLGAWIWNDWKSIQSGLIDSSIVWTCFYIELNRNWFEEMQ